MDSEVLLTAALGGVLGIVIGSFLNVVIHRLPRIMEQDWQAEYLQWAQEQQACSPPPANTNTTQAISLSRPASTCPQCSHRIRWWENIPVLSYLFLRGRCSACKTPISLRYPLVELTTAALFAYCAARWGVTPAAASWCLFSALLLSLALIDWDTTFLPDDLTLPLLWTGLVASALSWIQVSLPDAVWGAVGGYMSLWLVYWAFKLLTGKEGMGYGDFKLFAALGAWFGWQALVPIILLASVIGAIVGIALKVNQKLREGGYVPFGPFLAGGGFAAMLFGPQKMLQSVLSIFGL
ncbi:prepilin peptidase [Comamonas composti]|uniref:prepilin peptidase n=1 Tax=Comamonas composti TaxID=408558 RepID=UPI0004140B54|nr:A24 family peptidase [Comamonas composti]